MSPDGKTPRDRNPGESMTADHGCPSPRGTKASPVYPAEEQIIRSSLKVGARLPNGKMVTLMHGGPLSATLAAILQQAMRAALTKWDLCLHVKDESLWCIPVASERIVCEARALHEDRSWHHGAPCALCGAERATLAFHVIVARLRGWPGAWATSVLTNLCPTCVLRDTGLHIVL